MSGLLTILGWLAMPWRCRQGDHDGLVSFEFPCLTVMCPTRFHWSYWRCRRCRRTIAL